MKIIKAIIRFLSLFWLLDAMYSVIKWAESRHDEVKLSTREFSIYVWRDGSIHSFAGHDEGAEYIRVREIKHKP